jgi:hypothetical protein
MIRDKTSHRWGLLVTAGSFILLFLVLTPFVSSAQTTNGTSLSPGALDAFNKGVIAAKQAQNYPLAISYFQDARRLSPGAPVIYLNLGLAESKIPGRELRAIAWFAAYLEANPDAPNAAAVREQIAVLDVKSRSNVLRMIKTVQDVGAQTSDDKDFNLFSVARLLALSGDTSGALSTTTLMQNPDTIDRARISIVYAQTESGDIAGALKTVALIRDQDKGDAQYVLAITQAGQGDFANALKTADLIQGPATKSAALEAIAEAQIGNDDISDAQETLSSAQKSDDLVQDAAAKTKIRQIIAETQAKIDQIVSSQKGLNQLNIVEAKIKAGDIDGALKAAGVIDDDSTKFGALSLIAGAQTRDGDLVGAQKTIDLVQDSMKDTISNFCAMIRLEKDKTKASAYYSQMVAGLHGEIQDELVSYQLQASDILGAQRTAAPIQDLEAKNRAFQSIAKAQLESGDITGALATADLVQDERGKSWLQNTIAKAQIKAGDIAGAQKTWAAAQRTANSIEDANAKTSAQNDIAKDRDQAATKPIGSDWLDKLEDGNQSHACALNTGPFLDLASYLTAQHSDVPQTLLSALQDTAEKVIEAQNVIDKKLKLQSKP